MERKSQRSISYFLNGVRSSSKRCTPVVISDNDSYHSSQDEEYNLSMTEEEDDSAEETNVNDLTNEPDIDLEEDDGIDRDYLDPESVDDHDQHAIEKAKKKRPHRGAYKDRLSSKWAANRSFKNDWLSEYPFIEPIDIDGCRMVKCNICSWKNKLHKPLQCKKNNIDRHVGKLKSKVIVDGVTMYVFAGWEGPEKNVHARNAQQFEKYQALAAAKERKETIFHCMFQKQELLDFKLKCTQMRTILHLLQHGRPMRDYPEHESLLRAHGLPNIPSSHWSESAGWDFAGHMAEVSKDELRNLIEGSVFLSLSLDEVTAKDNSSWLCMHVYNVEKFSRKSYFLSITKMNGDATAESLYAMVDKELADAGLSMYDRARKLVCFGADGASVMSGCRTGLGVRLQTSFAPYMLSVHCMAHRTNLAFKIVNDFRCVEKVENLVKNVNLFYCRSPQRLAHFQQFAIGLTEGLKLLKDVDTRWISIALPIRRLCDEYVSVAGACADLFDEEKAIELLALLTDAETLLTLYALLPLLKELVFLIQQAQDRTIFISEYSIARKMACTRLEKLYEREGSFEEDKAFYRWQILVSLESGKSFLEYDESGRLCIHVKNHFLPLHCFMKSGRNNHLRKTEVRANEFDLLIQSIKNNMKDVGRSLVAELRSRFPRDELLDAMAIVFPNFWNNANGPERLLANFSDCLKVLISHFCEKHVVDGKEINGILDIDALKMQSGLFGTTMYAQFPLLHEPLEQGAVTRLWNKLTQHDYFKGALSEYIKLANLCMTMILGSVEDERAFSSLSFIKNKLRNRLDINLDATLRLYKCEHSLESFPYDLAFRRWKEATDRRGVGSVHEAASVEVPIISTHQPDVSFWQVNI